MSPKECITLKQYSIRLRNSEISMAVTANESHFSIENWMGSSKQIISKFANWLIPRTYFKGGTDFIEGTLLHNIPNFMRVG